MGFVRIEGTVKGPKGEQQLKFLVDSGAMYTLLPHDVWRQLGLEAMRTQRFSLADGTEIRRGISECVIVLPQGKGHTPVILGEPGDQALLGVVTLEEFGFMPNPFRGEIEPMRTILMAAR